MKHIIIVLFLLSVTAINAQTPEEWTQQRKTQLRYLAEQIAALKVWGGTLAKGYRVAEAGLSLIGDIKNSDMILHRQYFTSLTKASRAVAAYPKVMEVISLQKRIRRVCGQRWNEIKTDGQFTREEVAFLNDLFSRILDECTDDLRQFAGILTDDVWTMNDGERLARMDAIWAAMDERYRMVKSIGKEVALLAKDRIMEKTDRETIRAFYGLRP